MGKYLKLLRIHHYIKNLLLFAPLFFSKNILNFDKLSLVFLLLIPFCCVSSLIYILNDIRDKDSDIKHPTKRNRPIANGSISVMKALALFILLFFMTVIILTYCYFKRYICLKPVLWLSCYFFVNILYSFGVKNVPIADVILLASCYLIRIFYGAAVVNVEVSSWLYLTVLMIALYLGIGKRRNELRCNEAENTRLVLAKYTYEFLDKNMHICATLAMTFYSLWSLQTGQSEMMLTVPLVFVIFMKYSLSVEQQNSAGDPMQAVLHDKILLLLTFLYVLAVFSIMYRPW